MISIMSKKGDRWENAVPENLFAKLKFERIDRRVFVSEQMARTAIYYSCERIGLMLTIEHCWK